jgi:hypothetical protein
MRKKTMGKSSPQKATTRRKLSDLAPKRIRGGDASSVKGGITIPFAKIKFEYNSQ